MVNSGSCPYVSSESTQADPLHKLSCLILLVHVYIFVLFFLKITKCKVRSGSCLDVASECTLADPLHKLSYLILLVHGYIFVLFFLKITKCNGKVWLAS